MFFNFANLITKNNQNEKNSTDIIVGLCFTFICNGLTNPSLLYFKSDFRNSSVVKPLGDWSCLGKRQDCERS